jgi:hypothetical protein
MPVNTGKWMWKTVTSHRCHKQLISVSPNFVDITLTRSKIILFKEKFPEICQKRNNPDITFIYLMEFYSIA